MENLPEDVLLMILVRLQARQLAQMRSISKSWNAYLSRSSFIKSHLDRSIHNNDGILMVFPDLFPLDSKPFTTHPSRSPHLELPNLILFPLNPQSKYRTGRIIGSVNGLICFKFEPNLNSEVIYIWNPSLSALLTLPPYSMPYQGYNKSFRFGFDPKTDDYKVLKITEPNKKRMQIEIYSMRKGSWELLTQRIPWHLTWGQDQDLICGDGHDGHLHWLYSWKLKKTILAFDLGAQTFREIPLPDAVTGDNENYVAVNIGILGGKLCVMSSVEDGECEVWVMEEYGVAESWVKRHVFPPFSDYLYPFGFTSQNEYLFKVYEEGLALYDPIADKTKIFKYRDRYDWAGKVVEYVDSLVWITPVKRHNSLTSILKRFLSFGHPSPMVLMAYGLVFGSLIISRYYRHVK